MKKGRLSTELPKGKILDDILSSHRSCDRYTTIASHDLVAMQACHGHSLLDQWLWPIFDNEILCDALIFSGPISVYVKQFEV